MWFSAIDASVALIAFGLWMLVVDPTGSGFSRDALVAAGTTRWALAALGISTSHILYASVWFMPERFAAFCNGTLGMKPVRTFSILVAFTKLVQNCSIFVVFIQSTGTALVATAAQASLTTWVLGLSFMAFGQWLNASIYRAIGADGVYYGFKLGAPVPWCHGFPFNMGFRHPQYVGGFVSQIGVVALAVSPRALEAGLVPLIVWWFALYCVTSWKEASDDNDKAKPK